MHGIALTKYGPKAASTRQRLLQFSPYLEQEGITYTLAPLLEDAYLERTFAGGKAPLTLLARSYLKRIGALLRADAYDFLWVNYELFPYLPGFMEKLAFLHGKPVIYDIDDAVFHNYDQHPNPLVRSGLGTKLAPLISRVRLATCGNPYLETYIRRYSHNTAIIPTVLDTSIYVPDSSAHTALPAIGWIGSPSTWKFCEAYLDILRSFTAEQQATFRIVGAGPAAQAAPGFELYDWQEHEEVQQMQQMDIGIMPLPDTPWARGKCGYKLIQYMACGLPVIASPIGVNSTIVEHGVNGFLASTRGEWHTALNTLLTNADLRKTMGAAGRKKVESAYALQVYGPRLAGLFSSVLRQA